MELSQPRPYGTEGGVKPTHDFLSLYSHPTAHQDPRPSSQGYLRTHNFLQPLEERVGKTCSKEKASLEVSTAEKPPPPPPADPPPSVEHLLPGGIGTYSISNISYFNPKVPKPEATSIYSVAQASSTEINDENSNCSSYTGSGFTLWEESAVKKGKTGKENIREKARAVREPATRAGQWTSSERPSLSSSNNYCNSSVSLSSSQPPGQRNQSFIEMIKSAKENTQDDEFDDEEEFVLKKEASASATTHQELRVKVDDKSSEHKHNTPRSKHSATEQRRRSKINDRFQTLRELIPHSDQKRDKASFLLEVIEYIQFLQEKVHKFEGSYQGWNSEPTKLMRWGTSHRLGESFDQSQGINTVSSPPLGFAKLDEKNASSSLTVPGSVQNTVESDTSTATTFKALDSQPGVTNKAIPFPMSLQPNYFSSVRSTGALSHLPPRFPCETENTFSQALSQPCQMRSCNSIDGANTSDKIKEQNLTIEAGMISVSSAYSQGLLHSLTQALQASGVDLSQASISVQIQLGKRASSKAAVAKSFVKDNEILSHYNQGTKHAREGIGEDSSQFQKKLKTGKN